VHAGRSAAAHHLAVSRPPFAHVLAARPVSGAWLSLDRSTVAVVTDVIEASNRSGVRGVVEATFDVAQGG